MDNCIHWWLIEESTGPTSKGECKKCSETREFLNCLDDRYNPVHFIPETLTTSLEVQKLLKAGGENGKRNI